MHDYRVTPEQTEVQLRILVRLGETPVANRSLPLLIAHRGGAQLAPENTLEAFTQGVALGADILELDLHVTRDGTVVVLHDATVNRTTNGRGPVAAMTLAELRQLDAGCRFTRDRGRTYPWRGGGLTVPTLQEVFARFPTLRFHLDIKSSDPRCVSQVWELVQAYHLGERVLVGSVPHGPVARIRRLSAGTIATSASLREMARFFAAVRSHTTSLLRPKYSALQLPAARLGWKIVSRADIAAAHRLGVALHVWTLNSRHVMERYLRLGVDGVITDRPDVLREVLGR